MMSVYQNIRNFRNKALLLGGLVAILHGCFDVQRRIDAVVGDFNNDKVSDEVTISFDRYATPETMYCKGSYDAYISLGQKDGTLSPRVKAFHFELMPEKTQVRDVNGDGNEDFFFVSSRLEPKLKGGFNSSTDGYVALGNGDGTFQEPKKTIHYDTNQTYF